MQETQSYQRIQCIGHTGFKGFSNAVTPPLPYFHQWVSHIKRVLAQSSTKRPTFAFAGESGYTLGFRRKIAHKGSHGETGDVSDGDAIITLDTNRTFTNIPGPGIRTAYFAALGSWPGGALEERRKPSGQRCAYACRCPEGVAAPLGCVIFLQFGDVAVFSLCAQYFLNVRGRGVLLPSACFACCRNAGRPLVKMVYLPFSGVAEHHSLRGHFFC